MPRDAADVDLQMTTHFSYVYYTTPPPLHPYHQRQSITADVISRDNQPIPTVQKRTRV